MDENMIPVLFCEWMSSWIGCAQHVILSEAKNLEGYEYVILRDAENLGGICICHSEQSEES